MIRQVRGGECGYLAAAGMTLPLLSWQTADAHTHICDEQKYDSTEHWKECSCGLIETGSKAAHKEVTGICTDGIKCECGYEMHTATGRHDYPEDWTAVRPGSTHIKVCRNPGCGVTKTESCTGGTATCTEQATCEICGEKYGTTNPNNHTGTLVWEQDSNTHMQKYTCCNVITVSQENHKFQNGVCTICNYKCVHSGSTATCTSKAKCEICGEEYGDVDLQNHVKLQHIDAKAATYEENGNIEYWYCPDCGKYFSNVKATDEISQMQTVISRLAKTDFTPSETTQEVETTEKEETTKSTKQSKTVKTNKSKTSPQTGSDFELLFALLIGLSSATAAVVTIDKKRKKRNIK